MKEFSLRNLEKLTYEKTTKNEKNEIVQNVKNMFGTLYNLAFYDVDSSLPNYNKLLLDYKNIDSKRKNVFLLALYVLPEESDIDQKNALIEIAKKLKVEIERINEYEKLVYNEGDYLYCLFDNEKSAKEIMKKISRLRHSFPNVLIQRGFIKFEKKSKKQNKNLRYNINYLHHMINEKYKTNNSMEETLEGGTLYE